MNTQKVTPILTLVFALVLALPGGAFAQETVPTRDQDSPFAQHGRFTDSDIVEIKDSVEGYIYGRPPSPDTIKVFDREKGETVVLKFVKLLTGKGDAMHLRDTWVVVSAEFAARNKDQYVLWFSLSRQAERQERRVNSAIVKVKTRQDMKVRNTTIRSYNGVERTKIVPLDDGTWELVDIEPEAS